MSDPHAPVPRPLPRPRTVAYSLAGAFTVTMLWFTAQGFLWLDDYELQSLAFAAPWLDPTYLAQPWGGHFMPAGFALAQALAKSTPFTYVPMVLLITAGMGAFAFLSARLFLFILGDRWRALLPLALVLASGAVWDAATWWVAALNAVPLLIAIPLAVLWHLRWLRDGDFSRALLAWLAAVVACMFFEKALGLIAFVGLLSLALRGRWHPARRRWQAPSLVALYATTVVVFAASYIASTTGTVARLPDVDTLTAFLRVGGLTFPALLLGGPWAWAPPSLAATPLLASIVAANLVVALAIWQSVRSRRAALLWAGVLAYVIGLILIVAAGRSGWGVQVIAQPRYFVEAVVYAVLVAAVAWGYLDRPPSASLLPMRWQRPATLGLAILATQVVILGLATTLPALSRSLLSNPSRTYVVGAVASLADSESTVNNGILPGEVVWALATPRNQLRPFFAPIADPERFPDASGTLNVINAFGFIRPGVVDDPRATPSDEECPVVLASRSTVVTLPQSLPDYWHTVSFSYLAGAATKVSVSLGGGTPVDVPIAAGVHDAYVFLEGSGSTLQFSRVPDGVGVCVSNVRAGFAREASP